MGRPIQETIYDYCIHNPEKIHLIDEFDEERNSCTVHDVSIKDSSRKVWWYCKACDHHWEEYPYNRMNYSNTPCCNGRHPTATNNFKIKYAELMKDWDFDKNTENPEKLLPNSHKIVYWKCHKCGYTWKTKLTSRVQDYNKYGYCDCPHCSDKQTSKAELILYGILKETFSNIKHRYKINGIEYDIYIPELNMAIEYDGYQWHKNKLNMHIKKLNSAIDNGIVLVNIMEYIEGKDKPLCNYTDKHNIIEFAVNSTYDIADSLINIVCEYFNKKGIKIKKVDVEDIKKSLDSIKKHVNINNSLYAKFPWLVHWFSDDNEHDITEYKKADQRYIELKCPRCGATRKIKVHYIPNSFRKCQVCGCTDYIPEDYLERIRERDAKANAKKRNT